MDSESESAPRSGDLDSLDWNREVNACLVRCGGMLIHMCAQV